MVFFFFIETTTILDYSILNVIVLIFPIGTFKTKANGGIEHVNARFLTAQGRFILQWFIKTHKYHESSITRKQFDLLYNIS